MKPPPDIAGTTHMADLTSLDRRTAAVRPRTMRRQNLCLVLRQILEHGPRSRATIAEATGLTKSTVSTLVADLISRGLLADAGREDSGTVGRPGRLFALSGRTVAGLGLEINVDYLAVSVVDLRGRVRHERMLTREQRGASIDTALDALVELADGATAACAAEGLRPVAAALAVPGLVDVGRGRLVFAPNLGWSDVDLIDVLQTRMGSTVDRAIVDNEANLAAQGELWMGQGRQLGDFIHISGEVGVGAGVVIDGELVRGGAGFGGEFGHVPVADGPPCPCGSSGCLERLVGQEALLAAAGLDVQVGTTIGAPDGGAAVLAERASAGDPRTLRALEVAGTTLGRALATMVNLFAPDTVVLGGSFAALHDWMVSAMRMELERRAFVMRYADVTLAVSGLGAAAAVRGAATRAVRTVCEDPLLVPAVG